MTLISLSQIDVIPQLKGQDQTYLNNLILIADGMIKDYCKQDTELQTLTEYYSGNNRPVFTLRQKPVVAGSLTVWLQPQAYWGQGPSGFPSTSQLTDGVDYALDIDDGSTTSKSGILAYLGGTTPGNLAAFFPQLQNWPGKLAAWNMPVWPFATPGGNIKVSYQSGYAIVPQAVQGAAMMMVAWLARNMPSGAGLSTESLGGYSYSLTSGLMGSSPEMGSVKQLLSRFRDPVF